MNNTTLTILGIIVAAVIGIFVFQTMSDTEVQDGAMMKETSSVMSSSEDAMMNDDEGIMMNDDEEIMIKNFEAAMMKSSDEAMMKNEISSSSDAMMKKSAAVYTDYKAGVIGNGTTSVLFFHAAWCPSCKQANTELKDIYATGAPLLTTYKVDYDTSAELKQKYGVTYQHTFVVIDGTGKATKVVSGPTKAQILELVK